MSSRTVPFEGLRQRSSPAVDLVILVCRARQILLKHVGLLLKGHGLTLAQYELLDSVATTIGRCTTASLARELDLHPTTVGEGLRKLEARGFVSRRLDPEDHRATSVTISECGAERLERAKEVVQTLDLSVAGLSPRDEALIKELLAQLT